MVYPDLSYQKTGPVSGPWPIASVSDRILAFLIDFLVFTPVFSLITAGLLKQMRTAVTLRPDSPESWYLGISLFGSWFLLLVLTESFFVYFWKATPGQKFMQIEVCSIEPAGSLDLLQAVGRSFIHWGSFLLLAPIFAVYVHPLRRGVHDRAFETILLTRKREGDPGPLMIERNFFASWSRLFIFFMVLGLVMVSLRLRSGWESLSILEHQPKTSLCADVDVAWKGQERLDRAMGLFIAGEISASCLEREADSVLWRQQGSLKAAAELAKGILNPEDEVSQAYLDRVCISADGGEICAIANFLKSKDPRRGDLLRQKGLSMLTARLLLVREAVDKDQFASAAALISDLRQEALFDVYLDREEVRNVWKIQKQLSSRSPASSDLKEILQSFRERYELP